MQHVTISNIDHKCKRVKFPSFHGLFSFDAAKKPHELAAFAALRQLKLHHGFFKDNTLVTQLPPAFTPCPGVVGILMRGLDAEDEWNVAHYIDDENTYWVIVEDYEPGSMFQG